MLEGPWREGGSPLLPRTHTQAGAWVHVQRNNLDGIRAQLRKAEAALGPFTPTTWGWSVSGSPGGGPALGGKRRPELDPPDAFPHPLDPLRIRGVNRSWRSARPRPHAKQLTGPFF